MVQPKPSRMRRIFAVYFCIWQNNLHIAEHIFIYLFIYRLLVNCRTTVQRILVSRNLQIARGTKSELKFASFAFTVDIRTSRVYFTVDIRPSRVYLSIRLQSSMMRTEEVHERKLA